MYAKTHKVPVGSARPLPARGQAGGGWCSDRCRGYSLRFMSRYSPWDVGTDDARILSDIRVSQKRLGAEMLAPGSEHPAHLLAWVLQTGMTVAQMRRMPFYHPAIEEGLRTALRDLDLNLRAARTNTGKAP